MKRLLPLMLLPFLMAQATPPARSPATTPPRPPARTTTTAPTTAPTADTSERAEATRRNVGIEQVQIERAEARIKVLEAQIAALKKKLEAAKNGPPAPPLTISEIVASYAKLPNDLWPTVGEYPDKVNARQKWVDANIKEGVTWNLVGKIGYVSLLSRQYGSTVRVTGNETTILISLVDQGAKLWEFDRKVRVMVTVTDMKPEEVMDWNKGDIVSLTATFSNRTKPNAAEINTVLVEVNGTKVTRFPQP